ncbi:hypothetical protein ACQEVY_20595 [Streptomyces sp. CA-288835]|uniref:hypothetical protein n=1 Tax=Streptomyces sp. CA-288835 TaxID=3240069 RepID=UPI003D919DEC
MTYTLDYRVSPPAIVGGGEPQQGDMVVRLSRDADAPTPDQYRSLRAFHVLAEDRSPVARVVTEQPLGSRLSGRPAVYHVLDPFGAPLGRITWRRRRAFRIGRTRWTVEPVARPVLHGYEGRLVWWALWWPFGLPVALLWLITSILGDGDGGLRPPRRVIWRDPSRRAHIVFRAVDEDYQVLTRDVDPRLATALIGLHQSYDSPEAAGAGGWYEA